MMAKSNRLIQSHLALINLLMFQAVWWLSVLYQNQSLWLSVSLLLVHFAISSDVRQDMSLILKVALFGFTFDCLLMFVGVFQFQPFPFWLLAIWCHFAISLRYSLAFTQKLSWQINAILGGVFGCLSYLAGARFEAVLLPLELLSSGLILFFVWLVMFPMFVHISRA